MKSARELNRGGFGQRKSKPLGMVLSRSYEEKPLLCGSKRLEMRSADYRASLVLLPIKKDETDESPAAYRAPLRQALIDDNTGHVNIVVSFFFPSSTAARILRPSAERCDRGL